jgi:hypothetical protein
MGNHRLRALVALHLAIFAASFAAGWLRAGPAGPVRPRRGYWVETRDIAGHNLSAAVFLTAAGVLTAGVGGALLTATNGYAFGVAAGASGMEAPMALYAPAEIVVFATVAALATDLSLQIVEWLGGRAPITAAVFGRFARRLAGAAAVLLSTAALEAFAITLRAAP